MLAAQRDETELALTRQPFPRGIPSFSNGLRSINRPAPTDAASLNEYCANFAAFKPRVLAGSELTALSHAFESVTALDLGNRRINDFRPPKIEFVPISCCLLGTYVSHIVYGAETAMSEVLDIKARTGGRSTDLLGERDLHASFMPPIKKSTDSNSALISRDRGDSVPGTELIISKLDGLAAINTKLSMSSVVMAPQSSRVLLRR